MMFTWEVLAESGAVIGTVQAANRQSAGAAMRRMFYTGHAVRRAEEQDEQPGLTVTIESDRPHNYAVWEWSKPSRKWLMRGRFATPQAAAEVAGTAMIVIDVSSDTMMWWRGDWCSRQKPHAVPTLEIQKYDDTKQ